MLPAGALTEWRHAVPIPIDGLSLLSTADQQEEAAAIALVLREALETPGARAALVTPDRDLAGRVATELLRYGVVADDSAGEKLSDTPPAVFLRLLVRAVAEELAPVPLLALLKHPLAAAGLSPAACRAAARALELACLRGPRPSHGLSGLRRALDRGRTDLAATALLDRLEACLEPTLRIATADRGGACGGAGRGDRSRRDAWPRPTNTPDRHGCGQARKAKRWRPGWPRSRRRCRCCRTSARAVLPGLLDAVLEGAVVRSRRALRGRDGTEHPRVFIWGLLEARLQTADVMVLGGLAEGVWPPATDPGPWLSRPMRAIVGLPSPEEIVGQAAHDFVACACAAPIVVLSCPRRAGRRSGGAGALADPAGDVARAARGPRCRSIRPSPGCARWTSPRMRLGPVRPPRPCPPVALRPRRLSVTEIETWLRDPYAIHARHVLKLAALKPLDEATDAADYGSLVHDGLHLFLEQHGIRWPADAGGAAAPGDAAGAGGGRSARGAGRLVGAAAWTHRRLGGADRSERRSERAPVALSRRGRAALFELTRPAGCSA